MRHAAHARHGRPEAAHAAHLARVDPLLQRAGEDEERARADAVTEDLQDGPLQRERRSRKDPDQDEPHVADARVGDEPLQIGLAEGEDGAVDHPDDAQRDGDWSKAGGGLAEQRQHETEQTVGAGLQQQAREDDAARRRRFGVRVGQPRVHRHDGQLHGERAEEAQHQPPRRRRARSACPTSWR